MGMIDMTEGEADYLKYRFKQYLGSVSRAIQNRRLKEQKMRITLLDVLKLIERDYFPVKVCKDGTLDTRPQSVYNVTICFTCEEEWITCNIQNEILVPWYDCEVDCIRPDRDNRGSICIWLHDEEYIKKNYSQHLFWENEDKNDD